MLAYLQDQTKIFLSKFEVKWTYHNRRVCMLVVLWHLQRRIHHPLSYQKYKFLPWLVHYSHMSVSMVTMCSTLPILRMGIHHTVAFQLPNVPDMHDCQPCRRYNHAYVPMMMILIQSSNKLNKYLFPIAACDIASRPWCPGSPRWTLRLVTLFHF